MWICSYENNTRRHEKQNLGVELFHVKRLSDFTNDNDVISHGVPEA